MIIKKFFLTLFIFFLGLFEILAYQVDLPQPTQNIQSSVTINMSNSDPYYITFFNTINKYLWIFTGVVSFILVLTAGYWLVTSQGKSEDLKKANKMLVWGLVGIFVSLLSYVIIKVLINLF